ncbi:hypothetical protein DFH09DRAFT_1134556 [Mycena vulgaris]|nr:hypothetical protein DFH09DRAFT_1134556 [Mycena vulgaris]
MADALPDEIISEILSPALKVSEEQFADTRSETSPFVSLSVSSSAALLVCKAWLRVATPLLYHVVVLRSKAQARALQATLRDNPDLGTFVKMLRLEGGFGASMQNILQRTPNITDIFLSLHIRASDSTEGLGRGLAYINPNRLIIFDDPLNVLKNKQVVGLIGAIEKCAAKWTNLTRVGFPYLGIMGSERESFVRAICVCPTLKAISFPSPGQNDVLLFMAVAENPTLERIDLGTKRARVASCIPLKSRLSFLVRWTDTPYVEIPPLLPKLNRI